ncbi:MAG: ferredoxin [Candidatus Dormibacteria bacterium]
MLVTIDRDKCICSGGCVFACPEVFDQDQDGVVILLNPNPAEELRPKVNDAVNACPSGVIELLESDGPPGSPLPAS